MIYLGIGSNIGDRLENLKKALELLNMQEKISIKKVSSVYQTDPVGYVDQPGFLNMVVGIETTVSPENLMQLCLDIEQRMGRVRTIVWGPRNIDIDILLFHQVFMTTEMLTLPHPRFHERRFVLVPLVEIADENEKYNGKFLRDLLSILPEAEKVVLYATCKIKHLVKSDFEFTVTT